MSTASPLTPSHPPTPASRRRRAARAAGRAVPPLLILAGAMAGWQIYVDVSGISPVTLPSPWRVAREGVEHTDILWRHARATLKETGAGFSVSIAMALILGTLIDFSPPLRRGLYPLLVASQTIPIIAIAPLLIIWFGFGLAPKIIVITLYTFFPIVVAFAAGLAAAEPESLDLLRTFGASRLQVYRYLKIPASLPSLFTGLRIGATYAIVGAVFGEWAGSVAGLGYYMQVSRSAFRTDLVFAAVVVTAALSLALFLAVVLIERWLVPWRRGTETPPA